ncbi:amphoterin-induced protein 1-like isoform X2 [Brachyhypopomus gauderio]|uniref:amphoterin-induced protein 1-like isoform X1 n=1 Tax=Brachyhypopomus gauderio TaxID=698409 RepID=UPI004041C867
MMWKFSCETSRRHMLLPTGNQQLTGHGCGRESVCVHESVCKRACVCVKQILIMLLLSTTVFNPSIAASVECCQGTCICASNIISCSQRNLSNIPTSVPHYTTVLDLSFNSLTHLHAHCWRGVVHFRVLHTLLVNHNALRFLSLEAFARMKRLRHLDLSSNVLTQLDELVFEPLQHLEVLLLYNNHISRIDRAAFSGLTSLQMLYLSQNRVIRFPLDLLKDRHRLERLRLLDVSSNQIRTLPLVELQALPAWLKNGVYFHDNPLDCSCELYGMLTRWQQQSLQPVVDFPERHVCTQTGRVSVGALQLHLQLNCSTVHMRDEEALVNQLLILDCDSRHRDVTKTWLVPVANSSAQVLPGGRLRVGPLQTEDSGEYTCVAVGEGIKESVVVMLRVHNSTRGAGGGLSTAYTTLACCILCFALALLYLCVPPHCRCYGNRLAQGTCADSVLSVTLSATHRLQGAAASKQQPAYLAPEETEEEEH